MFVRRRSAHKEVSTTRARMFKSAHHRNRNVHKDDVDVRQQRLERIARAVVFGKSDEHNMAATTRTHKSVNNSAANSRRKAARCVDVRVCKENKIKGASTHVSELERADGSDWCNDARLVGDVRRRCRRCRSCRRRGGDRRRERAGRHLSSRCTACSRSSRSSGQLLQRRRTPLRQRQTI